MFILCIVTVVHICEFIYENYFIETLQFISVVLPKLTTRIIA